MTEEQKDEPRAEEPGRGSKLLRGCGVAIGIAALIFLFVCGACFISLSRW